MIHIILYQPEIPANTGNIIRLCANAGARLHLVRPLGFRLDDKSLARAGMDYREFAPVRIHQNWDACLAELGWRRLFFVTTRGTTSHDAPRYTLDDVFVFGAESRGLPQALLDEHPHVERLRIPMVTAGRSLNLANAAAVVLYEAWRQNGFAEGV